MNNLLTMGLASKLAASKNTSAYPTQSLNNYEHHHLTPTAPSASLLPDYGNFDAPPKYSPEFMKKDQSYQVNKQNAIFERMKSFNPFSSSQSVEEENFYRDHREGAIDFRNSTPITVGSNKYKALIDHKINAIIRENKWDAFYPREKLQSTLNIIYQHDYDELARRWQYPNVEIMIDLVSLALVDVMIFYDDSGSMEFDEKWNPTTEKKDDLLVFMTRIAEITTLFDSDGISIMPFKNKRGNHGITDTKSIENIVKSTTFAGGTPIGKNLDENILNPHVISQLQKSALEKPVLIYIITDGAPDVKEDVYNAISKTKNYLSRTQYGSKGVCYQFLQVGRDKNAQSYLDALDNDRSIGDIIDCTSYYELEEQEYARNNIELTPTLYITKAALGAIDSSYDEQDRT